MITKTMLNGLTETQAKENFAKFGPNTLSAKNRNSPLLLFLSKFISPVSLVLIFCAFFAVLFSEVRDGIVIFSMVLLSSILDFIQEYRSSKAASKLAKKLNRKAIVIRDGVKQEIDITKIVPQDVLFISTGDIIPADSKIIESDSLLVDESTLTGESFPVEKTLEDQVYTATTVVSGLGHALVYKTGNDTKFGQIDKTLSEKTSENEYEKGVKDFGMLIFKATIFITSAVFLINITKPFWHPNTPKSSLFELILFSITIAVGLTPELLPVVMSINMTRGALKMSKKGVLVKKLNSIPVMGSIDVLCTDKTGTLTENKITLMKHIDVEGNESEEVFKLSYLNSYFQAGLKNPLDEAILAHDQSDLAKYTKVDEIPYEFNRKRLSVVVDTKEKENLLICKGQVESILEKTKSVQTKSGTAKITKQTKQKVIDLYNKLSGEGFRVIALGTKNVIKIDEYSTKYETGLVLIGLLAFLDPPKLSAKLAIPKIEHAGISIKILTGDNELVTKKICNEIQIPILGIISGDGFSKLTPQAKLFAVEKNNIFARFNPEQKREVIKILKANGHTVGYMGDGINDAGSLKEADVGISVENAVDVARESASIILLKKDFNSLLDGIFEGRTTFGNTLKYMLMALSSNFGNMLSLVGAAIFLPFLPILPIQVLLNNSLYDISQLMIPTDNVDAETTEKPQKWDTSLIRDFMYIFGPLSSIFDFITFYIMYSVLGLKEAQFQTTWFVASICSQILVIYILRTRKLPFIQSKPSKWLILNTSIVLLTIFVIIFSQIGKDFGFTTLTPTILVAIAIIVSTYLVCVEVTKRWFYRFETAYKSFK